MIFTPTYFLGFIYFLSILTLYTSPILDLCQFFKRCVFPHSLGYFTRCFLCLQPDTCPSLSLPDLLNCFQFPVTKKPANNGHDDEMYNSLIRFPKLMFLGFKEPAFIYIYIYIYIYICVCVCVHICIYIISKITYIYIYIYI